MRLFAVGVEPVGFLAIGVMPRGVIAIGPLATGFLAIGQLSRGFISIGQLSLRVVSIGQLAVGMWWASGQLALAPTGGPAMLRITPYGVVRPIKWLRGYQDWRTPGAEKHGWKTAVSILYVIGIAVLIWFVAVLPARDAIFGPNGVFG
jgi:hypothetical protein